MEMVDRATSSTKIFAKLNSGLNVMVGHFDSSNHINAISKITRDRS